MGIKKIARPINKEKNKFVKWLESKGVENLNQYVGDADCGWHYFRAVSSFIGSYYVRAYFHINKSDSKEVIEHYKNKEDREMSSTDDLIKSIEKELKELEDKK